jgi:uncharacterized membrane protein YoaK (UPF0700 family)
MIVQSLLCWICFVVACNVATVGSIHPAHVVPNAISTTIATSERSKVTAKAVLDFPSAIDGGPESWIQSCNTTRPNSTDFLDAIETESEAASCDSDVDPTQDVSRQLRLTTRFLCCLSMISGFGEICSMKSYGCFLNMVTGSTVRILVAILEGRFYSVRVQCCAVSGYIAGVCLSQILQRKRGNRSDISRRESMVASLVPVVWLVLSFFSLPEFLMIFNQMYGNLPQASLVSFSAMAQAAGYGLIAQTLLDSFSISVNVYVITAQYIAIAKSVVDNVLLNRTRSLWSYLINLQQERAVKVLLSFLFGVVLAVGMYEFCTFLVPFQHSLTGLLYAASFIWFSRSSFQSVHIQPSIISSSR